jgi:polyhydroxyalkanoate synthase subunit PhaC
MLWPFLFNYDSQQKLLQNIQEIYTQNFDYIFKQTGQMLSAIVDSPLLLEDKRFNHKLWQDQGIYQYIANTYLISCQAILKEVENSNLKDEDKQRHIFFTKQYLDALSPSNFIPTNPQAVQAMIDSNGQSMIDGMVNYLTDLHKKRITQSQEDMFVLGENIACSSGDVICKTSLFELIRYHNGNIQYSNPILIVPPCINKYYILDLQAHNSMVKYLVEEGFDVYLISWKNISTEDYNFTWDNYVQSIQYIIDLLAKKNTVHVMGFCIGGTLAASAIAASHDLEHQQSILDKVASLTLLTTLLDFSNTGMLGYLIDKDIVNCYKHVPDNALKYTPIIKGADLANIFNMLRAPDLIWKYVSEHYLQGKKPVGFDILHWNTDPSNLTKAMYYWYLEHTYLNNDLVHNRAIVNGHTLNLNAIQNLPIYAVACEDDHIVPWQSVLQSAQHLLAHNKNMQFILSSSGHIAGIVNPPSPKNKRYYKAYSLQNNAEQPMQKNIDEIQKTNVQQGSWWINWSAWLVQNSDLYTNSDYLDYNTLYAAPGQYVMEKSYS